MSAWSSRTPSIYEILFKRVGRQPDELLFIDDSLPNVRASEALGMPASTIGPGVDLEKRAHRPRSPALKMPDARQAYSAGFSRSSIGSRAPLSSAFTPASVAAVAT